MRAQRTAQPRRACDTTVFSCANRGDGVPGQWPPIIAWPVRRVRRGLTVPLRTADVVQTERSSLRRVSARSWASFIAHLGAKVSGPHSAHGSAPSRHFPAPLRRSRVPSPGRPECARDGRDHPSPLDARRSGAERCTVVLVALCLCAVARVHVAVPVATSTRLAVRDYNQRIHTLSVCHLLALTA